MKSQQVLTRIVLSEFSTSTPTLSQCNFPSDPCQDAVTLWGSRKVRKEKSVFSQPEGIQTILNPRLKSNPALLKLIFAHPSPPNHPSSALGSALPVIVPEQWCLAVGELQGGNCKLHTAIPSQSGLILICLSNSRARAFLRWQPLKCHFLLIRVPKSQLELLHQPQPPAQLLHPPKNTNLGWWGLPTSQVGSSQTPQPCSKTEICSSRARVWDFRIKGNAAGPWISF